MKARFCRHQYKDDLMLPLLNPQLHNLEILDHRWSTHFEFCKVCWCWLGAVLCSPILTAMFTFAYQHIYDYKYAIINGNLNLYNPPEIGRLVCKAFTNRQFGWQTSMRCLWTSVPIYSIERPYLIYIPMSKLKGPGAGRVRAGRGAA